MTRASTPVKVGGIILVTFAAVVVIIEIILHIRGVVESKSYSISYVMLLISFVVGFVGMYILSPPRAKEGGQFIVDNAIKIVQVMKAGRRKGDPIAAIVEDSEGRTATMVIPAPETEVPIHKADEPGHHRRLSDMATAQADNPPEDTGEKHA